MSVFKPCALALFLSISLSSCQSGSDGPAEILPAPATPLPPDSRIVHVAVNGNDQSGSGSAAKPWGSIQFAIDSVGAGSVINVAAGVYAEKILFDGAADSGLEGLPVVIKSVGGILDGTTITPAGDVGMLTINNASHIVVNGLEIRNYKTATAFSNDATPIGILIQGTGENIQIGGNIIHGIEDNSTCTQNDNNCNSSANGIAVYGNTPGGLKGIKIIGNEVYENVLGASESLTINGNVDGFEVIDNFVHDNNNIGFDFIGGEGDICPACTNAQNRARNGIVRGNRAVNNSIIHFGANPWYAGDDGNAAGFYVDGGHHILIEQNISSGNDLGLELASENPGFGSDDIIVASNLIYNNFEIGIALGGYAQSVAGEGGGSASRLQVINNTLHHNSGHSSEITMNYRVHDLVFSNNIVFGETSIDENFEQPASHQSTNLSWNNNLWWASGTIDVVPVSDAQAIIANPQMADIENGDAALLAASAARNAGVNISGITSWNDPFWAVLFPSGSIPVHGTADVSGNPRTSGGIDIGATEQ